jgi:transcriptional regulator with XRE-family HTH domain
MAKFGSRVKEMLSDARMSQNELAETAGLSRSAVSDYVNARKMPGVRAIINISEALDCDVEELMPCGEMIE